MDCALLLSNTDHSIVARTIRCSPDSSGTAHTQRAEVSNPITEEFRSHLGFVLVRARLELIRRLGEVTQLSVLRRGSDRSPDSV